MRLFPLVVLTVALPLAARSQKPYFQQRVDTRIVVRLDDTKHLLHGFETLTYTNNSPDTLREIFLHLWPNAYRHDRTAFTAQKLGNGSTDFYYTKPEARGGIDSLEFRVNGISVSPYSHPDTPDIARIRLPRPLPPGAALTIETPFRVDVPRVFSRLGHTGQAYFISQWFPKPAVYDRDGWHPMPYLDQGEFYAEFGAYDVSITLPQNYVVMATGNLQTESEQGWMDSLAAAPPDTAAYAATPAVGDTLRLPGYAQVKLKAPKDSFPPSSTTFKTIRFTEDNVHDFAWFADKRWAVRKDTVHVPQTGAVVTAWAAFLPSSAPAPGAAESAARAGTDTKAQAISVVAGGTNGWEKATDYLKETIRHYSHLVGPYPYGTVKAVEGDMKAGGGMEYPTITVIDRGAAGALATVLVHEVGHNWFQGILATNERDNPWMDEGFNTFYENLVVPVASRAVRITDSTPRRSRADSAAAMSRLSPRIRKALADTSRRGKAAPTGYDMGRSRLGRGLEASGMFTAQSFGEDQPLAAHSTVYKELNYGLDVYYKTAMHLLWLEAQMGKDSFGAAMHDYYDTWKFRHPGPADFEAIIRKHAGSTDVDWFFRDAIRSARRVDFAVGKPRTDAGSTVISIRNLTPFAAPAGVQALDARDSVVAEAWAPPFAGKTTVTLPIADYKQIRLSPAVPDGKASNNTPARGIALRGFTGTEQRRKQSVFIAPALGANAYDGFMVGIVLHNAIAAPQPRFRFVAAPMYGFGSSAPAGAASLGNFFYPRAGILQEIALQTDVKTFHQYESELRIPGKLSARYLKVAPGVTLTFREPEARSPVTRRLTARAYGIREEFFSFTRDPVDSLFRPFLNDGATTYYGLLRYTHNNIRILNPLSYSAEAQLGRDFGKVTAEAAVRLDYHKKNKAFRARFFAGGFFDRTDTDFGSSRYWLNTTHTGRYDYLFDDTYYDRNAFTGFGARQVSIREGGFKVATPQYATTLGRSDSWLVSANLSTDVPRLPVRLFFDVATMGDATRSNPSGARFLYAGGLQTAIFGDAVAVYIPLLLSRDYRDYLTNIYGSASPLRAISFQVRLQDVNWLRAPQWLIRKAI